MDLRRIDLNLLVVLDVLLDERGVSRAAQRLGMSQPATSAALARLRALTRDPLLIRGRGEMFLTAHALALRDPLKDALEALRAALGAGAPMAPGEIDAHFRIVMTDYPTFVLSPPLINRLRQEAPRATLEVLPLERPRVFQWLQAGIADAAIVVPDRIPRGMLSAPLFEDVFAFVCAPGHVLAGQNGGRCRIEDVARFPFVDVSFGRELMQPLHELLSTASPGWQPAVVVPQFMMMLPIVMEGACIGVMGRLAAAAFEARGMLAVLDVDRPMPRFACHLVWHPRVSAAPEQIWLREAVRTAAIEATLERFARAISV